MPPPREFDLTLFGASGFVGRLVAMHLAQHAPAGLRIALAGRSAARVEEVRTELGAPARHWQVCSADSQDGVALQDMARRSQVVATTVGPYVDSGLALVQACADAGTDYADLTGEVLFIRDSICAAHARAQHTGARIVHACGFDSVPSDLAVHLLHRQARREDAGELTDTSLFLESMRGGLSGGTIDSMRRQLHQVRRDPQLARVLGDPEVLSGSVPGAPGQHDVASAFVAAGTGQWAAPFVMGPVNTRVVRRSNALLARAYGPQFRYRELVPCGPGLSGRVRASVLAGGAGALTAAMTTPGISQLLDRILPAPGQGPSAEVRASGHFRMSAQTMTNRGIGYTATVAASSDPGYSATAVMFGQAALALTASTEEHRHGGVLTPATAIGDELLERLPRHGFTLQTARHPA